MNESPQPDGSAVAETLWSAARFLGTLRPSQSAVVEIARRQLADGEHRVHVVAPPGSGKTVLGLYLWAECVRRPAVVLSPNSAIQAQWAARTSLFQLPDVPQPVSTDADRPGLLTSLTYQSLTLPRWGDEDLDAAAETAWIQRLIEGGQAQDPGEATVWIADLKRHNPDYYAERLGVYRKDVRDAQVEDGNALDVLHERVLETLARLRDRNVGLMILDECHHLMGHWGRVLGDVHGFLQDPIIIGLTATPPDRDQRDADDVERYDAFFGPVDFEVPVPAVVKDGFLAPYQDLAYFVRPAAKELSFVAQTDQQFREIVDELSRPRPISAAADQEQENVEPLQEWVVRVLTELRLPTGSVKDWASFEKRDPEFARASRTFLMMRGITLPPESEIPPPETLPGGVDELEVLMPVLDRYIRHGLRRSPLPENQDLAERAIRRLRMLGIQITETGPRACASPVTRVMAYSRSKPQAAVAILRAEQEALGDRIRAVVLCDFEKTSAIQAEVSHLLDEETGGAVAAFRTLLQDPVTDGLDPVLVTGSSVLVDDDLLDKLLVAARQWLAERRLDVELSDEAHEGFHVLNGRGADWSPRVYVSMLTDLFQAGLTRCLVGTRGLLGEGWDANKINVLVDLTTVTTSMSVNQLRGRSIRIDPDDPEKVASNWDVVCIAPEFAKGLDDYQRFIRKHKTIFGVTDDGEVEKGVGHVHPAFTELKPEGLESSLAALNTEMLRRCGRRAEARELWRIGEPYEGRAVRTVEASPGTVAGFPPLPGRHDPWSEESLTMAVGRAVLGALREAKLIRSSGDVQANARAGGYVRVFLQEADESESARFAAAVQEVFAPLVQPAT
jgi:Type III restriction enzyme, res subunit